MSAHRRCGGIDPWLSSPGQPLAAGYLVALGTAVPLREKLGLAQGGQRACDRIRGLTVGSAGEPRRAVDVLSEVDDASAQPVWTLVRLNPTDARISRFARSSDPSACQCRVITSSEVGTGKPNRGRGEWTRRETHWPPVRTVRVCDVASGCVTVRNTVSEIEEVDSPWRRKP